MARRGPGGGGGGGGGGRRAPVMQGFFLALHASTPAALGLAVLLHLWAPAWLAPLAQSPVWPLWALIGAWLLMSALASLALRPLGLWGGGTGGGVAAAVGAGQPGTAPAGAVAGGTGRHRCTAGAGRRCGPGAGRGLGAGHAGEHGNAGAGMSGTGRLHRPPPGACRQAQDAAARADPGHGPDH